MKKLMTLTLALSLVAMSSMAFAQPEPGDIGVFADPAGTDSTLDFTVGQTTFYVVAFDLEGNPNGYEFGVSVPLEWFVLSVDWWDPEGVSATPLGDIRSALVGAGGCLDGTGANVLAEVVVFSSDPVGTDIELCIGPADSESAPSSFDPPVPGYNTCDSELIPFGVAQNGMPNYPNGCLIVNATMEGPVATEGASFGEVKARF